jgi:hypothetical protein
MLPQVDSIALDGQLVRSNSNRTHPTWFSERDIQRYHKKVHQNDDLEANNNGLERSTSLVQHFRKNRHRSTSSLSDNSSNDGVTNSNQHHQHGSGLPADRHSDSFDTALAEQAQMDNNYKSKKRKQLIRYYNEPVSRSAGNSRSGSMDRTNPFIPTLNTDIVAERPGSASSRDSSRGATAEFSNHLLASLIHRATSSNTVSTIVSVDSDQRRQQEQHYEYQVEPTQDTSAGGVAHENQSYIAYESTGGDHTHHTLVEHAANNSNHDSESMYLPDFRPPYRTSHPTFQLSSPQIASSQTQQVYSYIEHEGFLSEAQRLEWQQLQQQQQSLPSPLATTTTTAIVPNLQQPAACVPKPTRLVRPNDHVRPFSSTYFTSGTPEILTQILLTSPSPQQDGNQMIAASFSPSSMLLHRLSAASNTATTTSNTPDREEAAREAARARQAFGSHRRISENLNQSQSPNIG